MRRHLDRTLKLSHLRVLDALQRHGSLLKAAGPLGLTQPALSRTLHDAEQVIGRPLFERLPRGVRPTEAGVLVAATAARMLAEFRRLDEALDQLDDKAVGIAAIGSLPVAAAGVLPGALQRLRAMAPNIRLRLEQGRAEELLPLLSSGAIDMVVGRLYPPLLPDGLVRETLWEEPIVVLARDGHPILQQGPADAAMLGRHELLLPTVSQRVGQEIEHALALMGLSPPTVLRSSAPGFMREMLLATDMIAVMPQLMMAGDLERGTLRMVRLATRMPRRAAGLTLPGDRMPSPAAQMFVAALKAYLASMADAGLAAISGADGG